MFYDYETAWHSTCKGLHAASALIPAYSSAICVILMSTKYDDKYMDCDQQILDGTRFRTSMVPSPMAAAGSVGVVPLERIPSRTKS